MENQSSHHIEMEVKHHKSTAVQNYSLQEINYSYSAARYQKNQQYLAHQRQYYAAVKHSEIARSSYQKFFALFKVAAV
jgi:hypothetical protein